MFCGKFGKNNSGTSLYCQSCGNQLQNNKQNQVMIAELYDGGSCERYLFFGYSENSFFLEDTVYNYNANREIQNKIIKLDSLVGFNELINIVQKEFDHFIKKPKKAKELHCYYLSEATQSHIHMILDIKNVLQAKTEQLLKDNKNKQIIMGYLHFSADFICSNMLPEGIPKLYKEGSSYTVITSFDAMRGPLGVYKGLDADEAFKKLISAVEFNLEFPENMFFYHPEYKSEYENIEM